MRAWIDLTNTAHVLVLRPLVDLLERDGHEVTLTARPLSHTLELLDDWGHPYTAVGRYGGAGRAGKALAAASRVRQLLGFARRRQFDCALAHGSTDLPPVCRVLRIPNTTMFDYEWAATQHHVNCRLARAVVVPEAIPPERLHPYGVKGKLRRYEGLKEEYYLSDFEPDDAVLAELGLTRDRRLVVVRTPPEVSLYHRFENPLFAGVLKRLETLDTQTVVLPRTPEQRAELRRFERFVVPERAVDAQSLVAFADLVVSAGGTMNREAVALGTPVFTTFEGRLGAVDEGLLREGRLRRLEDPEQVNVERRAANGGLRVRRDPRELVKLLLSAAA